MNLISGTVMIPIIMLVIGVVMLVVGFTAKKTGLKILGIALAVLAVFGVLHYTGLLTGVPIMAYGLPALFSVYFDLFSGFVQALVFTLLTMVYIAGACPPPEEKTV